MYNVAVIDRQSLNVIVYDTRIALNVHDTRHLDPWIRKIDTKSLQALTVLQLLLWICILIEQSSFLWLCMLLRSESFWAWQLTLFNLESSFSCRILNLRLRTLRAKLRSIRCKIILSSILSPLVFENLALLDCTTLHKLVWLKTSIFISV